jgi:hypothetical protein
MKTKHRHPRGKLPIGRTPRQQKRTNREWVKQNEIFDLQASSATQQKEEQQQEQTKKVIRLNSLLKLKESRTCKREKERGQNIYFLSICSTIFDLKCLR